MSAMDNPPSISLIIAWNILTKSSALTSMSSTSPVLS